MLQAAQRVRAARADHGRHPGRPLPVLWRVHVAAPLIAPLRLPALQVGRETKKKKKKKRMRRRRRREEEEEEEEEEKKKKLRVQTCSQVAGTRG